MPWKANSRRRRRDQVVTAHLFPVAVAISTLDQIFCHKMHRFTLHKSTTVAVRNFGLLCKRIMRAHARTTKVTKGEKGCTGAVQVNVQVKRSAVGFEIISNINFYHLDIQKLILHRDVQMKNSADKRLFQPNVTLLRD